MCFLDEDILEILKLLVSLTYSEDKWVWRGTSNSWFSVKNACHLHKCLLTCNKGESSVQGVYDVLGKEFG